MDQAKLRELQVEAMAARNNAHRAHVSLKGAYDPTPGLGQRSAAANLVKDAARKDFVQGLEEITGLTLAEILAALR